MTLCGCGDDKPSTPANNDMAMTMETGDMAGAPSPDLTGAPAVDMAQMSATDGPAPVAMCADERQACSGTVSCCGGLKCDTGVCICRAPGDACMTSDDCCSRDNFACVNNVCTSTATCSVAPGDVCSKGAAAPACCTNGRTCASSAGVTRCCSDTAGKCSNDNGCCGAGVCQGGTCCQPTNTTCGNTDQCCSGNVCESGKCVKEMVTCTLAEGATCVQSSETECCAGNRKCYAKTGTTFTCSVGLNEACTMDSGCSGVGVCSSGVCKIPAGSKYCVPSIPTDCASGMCDGATNQCL
jgi:hypothetical protein